MTADIVGPARRFAREALDQLLTNETALRRIDEAARLIIDTPGKKERVVNTAKTARALGMKVIALTGRSASPLETAVDLTVCCPAGPFADRVRELHIEVVHILIELVERHFHPGNHA